MARRALRLTADEPPEALALADEFARRDSPADAFVVPMPFTAEHGPGWAAELAGFGVPAVNDQSLVVDMSEAFPKPLTDEVVRAADVVVTMGCGDACPIYPGKKYEDWVLDDPAEQDLETVRRIRDEIDERVQELIGELLPTDPPPAS